MKTKITTRFILFTLTLSAMLLSACSGVNIPVTGDNSNVNGSPSTPVFVDNGNNANLNDNTNTNSNGNANTNDSGIEIVGVVEVISEDSIRINGVTYQLANLIEFTNLISVGDQIRFHLILNEDGTFTILQFEIITANDNGNNNANSNDNNGNDANSNDANSNDNNVNNNVNSNDDNSNNANSNDDNDNDDNSNDDNDNDNEGGNDNDDDNDNDNNDNG